VARLVSFANGVKTGCKLHVLEAHISVHLTR